MGLGLQLCNDGHNIVFAGGTGILVFLDVVGKMILSLADNDNISEFGLKFKLTLYYTA